MSRVEQRGRMLELYVAASKRYPLLSRDEEMALARRYKETDDREAARLLALSNLRFVMKIAHEFSGYGLDLGELIQEGNVGLLIAITKFDPERGHRFITYAVWWIRAQLWALVMRSASVVRFPDSATQRKLFFRLRAARQALEQRDSAEVTEASVAEELGVTVEELATATARLAGRDVSLEASPTELRLVKSCAIEATQERELGERETSRLREKWLGSAMRTLDRRERAVLRARYLAPTPSTLDQMGKKFHVSRERARQLQERALAKMRHHLADAPVEVREAL